MIIHDLIEINICHLNFRYLWEDCPLWKSFGHYSHLHNECLYPWLEFSIVGCNSEFWILCLLWAYNTFKAFWKIRTEQDHNGHNFQWGIQLGIQSFDNDQSHLSGSSIWQFNWSRDWIRLDTYITSLEIIVFLLFTLFYDTFIDIFLVFVTK